jgi:hypothetical protein
MPDLVTQTKGGEQPNSENDKPLESGDEFLIWSDALPQLSNGQIPNRHQMGKCYWTHKVCTTKHVVKYSHHSE